MAVFEYRAINAQGKQQKGTHEADSVRQVRQLLREQGFTPLSIISVNEKKHVSDVTKQRKAPFLGRKLPASQLALFTRQLATLIHAAMPIEEALAAVAAQQEKSWVKNIFLSVRSQVMEGFTLAKSLDSFPQHFPQMYRATVAAGEYAGHLDKVLMQLADHAEKRMQSKQKVQLAFLYPAILVLASVGIVSFLLGYVVPDIIKVFVDNGQALPVITQVLIGASEGFQRWWPWIFGLLALIIVVISRSLTYPAIRLLWHERLLRLPIIGRFSRALNTAQFASTLSILTKSGVPLVDALGIAAQVVSNDKIRESVLESARQVSEGSSLYRSLKNSGYFPPLMLHMIASGESTGELDTMLERTANNQQMELESKIAVTVGLLEPLILVIMGGVVLLVVLAILLPILNMNTLISG